MFESLDSPGKRSGRQKESLFAEIESLEKLIVLVEIVLFQVVEQLASTAGHGDQPSARMEVLSIGSKVLGQMIDASG